MRARRLLFIPLLMLILAPAVPALAVDGVVEINQACAATGCFPGDAPGFPVQITAAGSYRLTGNLEVPDKNTSAITVAASDVGIDLNGFVIGGPNVCTRDHSTAVVTCTLASDGIGNGIGSADTVERVRIANGSIRGMGGSGIRLSQAADSHVEAVRVSSCGALGVACNDCPGPTGQPGCLAGCSILNSSFSVNGLGGIDVQGGSIVAENRVFGNGGFGISALNTTLGDPLIRDNVVSANEIGIRAGGGLIVGNTISWNSSFGIVAFTVSTGFSSNVLQLNNGGGAQTSGQLDSMGINLCLGAPCP